MFYVYMLTHFSAGKYLHKLRKNMFNSEIGRHVSNDVFIQIHRITQEKVVITENSKDKDIKNKANTRNYINTQMF